MTFRDVLGRLDEFDKELTIYTLGGASADLSAPAVVAMEPDDGSTPSEADGLDYLLEVDAAVEAIVVWRDWRDGRVPTIEDRYQAVTYYASQDSFLPA